MFYNKDKFFLNKIKTTNLMCKYSKNGINNIPLNGLENIINKIENLFDNVL